MRQGRRQKNFQGGANGKKPKNSIKEQKIALSSLFQGWGEGAIEKKIKIGKKKKIALLSLYLLYL